MSDAGHRSTPDGSLTVGDHFGRDAWNGHRMQWFGPFGVGVERREITLRFWLPKLSWALGVLAMNAGHRSTFPSRGGARG